MKEIKLDASKVWHSWDQVSYGKFLQVLQAQRQDNNVKILSIATDIDEHVLRKAKIGPDFEVVMTRLRFLNKPPVWLDTPTKLGHIRIPKDVTFESTEQFETMRMQYSKAAQAEEASKDPIEEFRKFGLIAAIYYQPLRDRSDFDEDRVHELMEEINQLSCMEVVSVGRFFWAKLLSIYSGIPLTSLTQVTPRKNWRQDLKHFLRRSISTLRSRFSPTGTS